MMKNPRLIVCLLLMAVSLPSFAQTINDLTGINSHPFEPISLQKRFSWVRAWHDWSNDAGFAPSQAAGCPDISNANDWNFSWNPSGQQSGPYLDYDAYYGALKQRGIPVLKGTARVLRGLTSFPVGCPQPPLEQKPFCLSLPWQNGANDPTYCGFPALNEQPDPTSNNGGQEDPNSYAQHALWVSFFAAKYGQGINGYNTALMQPYSSDNPLMVNQSLIQYLEDNNEPNKSWWDAGATQQDFDDGNTRYYFSPDQFAAMLTADLTGNGLTINGSVPLGATNSSGGVEFVMGGLAGLNGEYLNVMGSIPGGATANFHHYCTDQSAAQKTFGQFTDVATGEFMRYDKILLGQNGQGVRPEEDNLREKLQWLKDGTTGVEKFWFTEFGYDSYPAAYGAEFSGINAPALSGPDGFYDSQKVQAQWLVRGVLEAAWSKAVDKMFLFELADNPTVGNNHYRFSGLVTDGYKAKRSWYYIMTLKNRLGGSSFEKEITDGLIVTEGQFDVAHTGAEIRIYEFKGPGGNIYAIWSPTAGAVAPFTCNITFPNGGDYELNGGATLYEIQELNEKGNRKDWSQHVSGQTISNIPVSETPVFLKINKAESTYPNVNHVTNLTCSPGCCNSVELSWDFSGSGLAGITRNTLVFYREKEGPTCPPFDFAGCNSLPSGGNPETDLHCTTLYANYTGMQKRSITVTGLELGKEYCFWVIPVGIYGNVPDVLGAAPSCSAVVGKCTGCLLNITTQEVSYDPGWAGLGGVNPDLASQVQTILGTVGGGANSCSNIAGPPCNPNDLHTGENAWTFWQNPAPPVLNEPTTFFINFASPKKIKAIYAQDWTGNGEVLIEYKDCHCDAYRTLTRLELKGFPPPCNEDGTPNVIQQSNLSNVIITGLKVTKLHSGVAIRSLHFCGEDAVCPPNFTGLVPGTPNDFVADEVDKNSALLKWTAATFDTNDPTSDLVDGYALSISEMIDENEALVNPVDYEIEADPFQLDVSFRLAGLAPATTYHAELKIKEYPCPPYPDPGSIIKKTVFTTDGVGTRGSDSHSDLKTQTNDPYTIHLSPNPAKGKVKVSITSGKMESIIIMDTNGRQLKKATTGPVSEYNLDISGLASGMYWLRTIRNDKTPLTVLLVKSN